MGWMFRRYEGFKPYDAKPPNELASEWRRKVREYWQKRKEQRQWQ